MDDGSGARRKPARYLAPLALAAVLAATYLIVAHSTHPGTVTARSLQGTAGRLREQGRRPGSTAPVVHASTSYIVRAGDTLSEISQRVGIPLSTLEQLNPSLQVNAIQVGQRVRLRR